jgi:hypothetical protein
VLIIIGLIIGATPSGQEMVSAAATRTQATQIQKYDAAVDTFKTTPIDRRRSCGSFRYR